MAFRRASGLVKAGNGAIEFGFGFGEGQAGPNLEELGDPPPLRIGRAFGGFVQGQPADDARSHLGADRYDDALDTGRGFTAVQAAAMLRDPGTPAG